MTRGIPLQGYWAVTVLVPLVIALVADQASKWMMLGWLQTPARVVEVLPILDLRLGFNEGSAFGMLGGAMTGRPLAMAALTGAITAAVLVGALRSRTVASQVGLGLVAGGSLGNILDRLRQGAVTDFLDLHWQGWHWPTFNLADVAIVLGVGVLLSGGLWGQRNGEGARVG